MDVFDSAKLAKPNMVAEAVCACHEHEMFEAVGPFGEAGGRQVVADTEAAV